VHHGKKIAVGIFEPCHLGAARRGPDAQFILREGAEPLELHADVTVGEYVYTAEKDTVTSAQALADPFHERVTVGTGFLRIPVLRNTITDTHFHARDRLGRTLVFLARMLESGKLPEARAIAVDERTAALTDKDGKTIIEGEGNAYFLRAAHRAEICRPGTPLTFRGISVYRVARGAEFDLASWKGRGGAAYELNVEAGVVRSTQAGGSPY
jgi:cyanophycinase-like exopeptidase